MTNKIVKLEAPELQGLEKIKEFEIIAKELDAEKLRLSAVIKSVCEHSWMNTGMSVQGKSLMVCTKCENQRNNANNGFYL